eukprot:219257-Rhodomonas_salina.1
MAAGLQFQRVVTTWDGSARARAGGEDLRGFAPRCPLARNGAPEACDAPNRRGTAAPLLRPETKYQKDTPALLRCPVWTSPRCVVSGTGLGYRHTRPYAVSATDLAYDPTRKTRGPTVPKRPGSSCFRSPATLHCKL